MHRPFLNEGSNFVQMDIFFNLISSLIVQFSYLELFHRSGFLAEVVQGSGTVHAQLQRAPNS